MKSCAWSCLERKWSRAAGKHLLGLFLFYFLRIFLLIYSCICQVGCSLMGSLFLCPPYPFYPSAVFLLCVVQGGWRVLSKQFCRRHRICVWGRPRHNTQRNDLALYQADLWSWANPVPPPLHVFPFFSPKQTCTIQHVFAVTRVDDTMHDSSVLLIEALPSWKLMKLLWEAGLLILILIPQRCRAKLCHGVFLEVRIFSSVFARSIISAQTLPTHPHTLACC